MSATDSRSRALLTRFLVHELVSRYGTDRPDPDALNATLAPWRARLDESAVQEAISALWAGRDHDGMAAVRG